MAEVLSQIVEVFEPHRKPDHRLADPGLILIQVESQEERYADGHIPGAVHLPRGMLEFDNCIAFEDFRLVTDAGIYEFSDIDTSNYAMMRGAMADYFTLFAFAAKYDPVPAKLTQNHVNVIQGFLGQTTSFRRSLIKNTVTVNRRQIAQYAPSRPPTLSAY